jgi:hypothetical protein
LCFAERVPLLHDNAHQHSAVATVEAFRRLKFEMLPHFLYIPDLVASDIHMFGPLKETLRGRIFVSDEGKFRTGCLRGFGHNRKLSSQTGREGL